MFVGEFSSEDYVKAGLECIEIARDKDIAKRVGTTSETLMQTVDDAFGRQVTDLATKSLPCEEVRNVFLIYLRADIARVEGVPSLEPEEGSGKGTYQVEITHTNSGESVYSSWADSPEWKEGFLLGPVGLRDVVKISLFWRKASKYGLLLRRKKCIGLVMVLISAVPVTDSVVRRYSFGKSRMELVAGLRLWRDPDIAYSSHVVVMLTLLKTPERVVGTTNWGNIWTAEETAFLQAHAIGLPKAVTLTARFHALIVSSQGVTPNFPLLFETLSELRKLGCHSLQARVVQLCRRLNDIIHSGLHKKSSMFQCENQFARLQLTALLGCCEIMEDFDLSMSKNLIKDKVITQSTIYFNEWLETVKKGSDNVKLSDVLNMIMVSFVHTFGELRDTINSMWGDELREYLADPARKFIVCFQNLGDGLDPEESFQTYCAVVKFCSYFYVQLDVAGHCFSVATILQWFDEVSQKHTAWISKIIARDDLSPETDDAIHSCAIRDFLSLINERLCSIYKSLSAKHPLVTKRFADTLCACCQCFYEKTLSMMKKKYFFSTVLNVTHMSRNFSMVINGLSKCFEFMLRETVHIRDGSPAGDAIGDGNSSIDGTEKRLKRFFSDAVEGFLAQVAFTVRRLISNVAQAQSPKNSQTSLEALGDYLNKLLSGLYDHLDRMVFATILETLFRCCVEVLGAIAADTQNWSPYTEGKPSAFLECARLIRGSFHDPTAAVALPDEKVNVPSFLFLEAKLERLVNTP